MDEGCLGAATAPVERPVHIHTVSSRIVAFCRGQGAARHLSHSYPGWCRLRATPSRLAASSASGIGLDRPPGTSGSCAGDSHRRAVDGRRPPRPAADDVRGPESGEADRTAEERDEPSCISAGLANQRTRRFRITAEVLKKWTYNCRLETLPSIVTLPAEGRDLGASDNRPVVPWRSDAGRGHRRRASAAVAARRPSNRRSHRCIHGPTPSTAARRG
jgi:hypothetical protein